jgi:hypothetical protein
LFSKQKKKENIVLFIEEIKGSTNNSSEIYFLPCVFFVSGMAVKKKRL